VYTAERWREALKSSVGEEAFQERIREATSVGLPVGGEELVELLGRMLGRELHLPAVRAPEAVQESSHVKSRRSLPYRDGSGTLCFDPGGTGSAGGPGDRVKAPVAGAGFGIG
jgi:hypothetical protein